MNYNTLKILSAISALCICFPGEKITLPLGASLILLVVWTLYLIEPVTVFCCFAYLVLSASCHVNNLSDKIITVLILVALIVYVGCYGKYFITYGNALSTTTLLIASVFCVWTIIAALCGIAKERSLQ